MSSFLGEELAQAQRELAYYKGEYTSLGARMLRLQEEQGRVFREAQRSHTLFRLIREAHRSYDNCETAEELTRGMTEVISQTTLCDRVMLLQMESADEFATIFRSIHMIGFGPEPAPEMVILPSAPSFFLTSSLIERESPADELTEAAGAPFLLWAYDDQTGLALLLGNHLESNVHRPFEVSDRGLVRGALAIYIDVLTRKRGEFELRLAKEAAESANSARRRLIQQISRDLREQANIALGSADVLSDVTGANKLNPQQASCVRVIHESGRRSLELIDHMVETEAGIDEAPFRSVEDHLTADGPLDMADGDDAASRLASEIEALFGSDEDAETGDGATKQERAA